MSITASTKDAPPAISVKASRFVTIDLASAITGLTKGAIRTNIGKGIWVEGREYLRQGGRVFIDIQGFEKWVMRAA
jgi:Putative excisionase (DUF1233)